MKHRQVSSVMTPADNVVSAHADTPYKEIARLLAEHRISAVPVLDDTSHVVGVVSEADLLAKESDLEQPAPTLSVEVIVVDGVVHLHGEVTSRSVAELIATLVGRADGVVDVVDNLTYTIDDTKAEIRQGPIHGVFEGRRRNR